MFFSFVVNATTTKIVNISKAMNRRRHQWPPGARTSLAFYTNRIRTSTMFFKESVKMYSVTCQLSVKRYINNIYKVLFIIIAPSAFL